MRDTAQWHCGKVKKKKMQKGDAVQQLKSVLHQGSNDVCFGKTANVRQVAIRLLYSRHD